MKSWARASTLEETGVEFVPRPRILAALYAHSIPGPSACLRRRVPRARRGRLATGTFSDFSIATGPSITGLMYIAGSFSGSFQTLAGYSYQVQYKDNITNPMWQILTTIPGDGTVKSFTDPGPAVAQRFYRVVIQ